MRRIIDYVLNLKKKDLEISYEEVSKIFGIDLIELLKLFFIEIKSKEKDSRMFESNNKKSKIIYDVKGNYLYRIYDDKEICPIIYEIFMSDIFSKNHFKKLT